MSLKRGCKMEDKYERLKNEMILRMYNKGVGETQIAHLTGFSESEISLCIDQLESTYDQEMNSLLNGIKEEFFDDKIMAYKLTKMGLIELAIYIQPDKLLDFYKKLKHDSFVIEIYED